jgi:hypothetical protein
MSAYKMYRVGARGHREEYFEGSTRVVISMVCFTNMSPWQWTEEQFIEWSHSLEARNLSPSTRRFYRSAIKLFLEYICKSFKINTLIKQLTGHRPLQIVTGKACSVIDSGGAS